MPLAEIVFWSVAGFTILSAALVVLNNQLLYSALALLFSLFGVAGLCPIHSKWPSLISKIQYRCVSLAKVEV